MKFTMAMIILQQLINCNGQSSGDQSSGDQSSGDQSVDDESSGDQSVDDQTSAVINRPVLNHPRTLGCAAELKKRLERLNAGHNSLRTKMSILGTLVVCGFFILGNVSATDGQVCDGRHYVVLENPRRSTAAVYDPTVDIPLCDYGIDEELWYRFRSNSGENVIERAENDSVPINRCGTQAPIYIQGLESHPSADFTTKNATVCANFGGDPCNWMEIIEIHRCPAEGNQSFYFLYKLKAAPGCPLSYCVGDKPPCNRGEYWSGFLCVNYFPPMTGFPLFGGPHTKVVGLNEEVYFTCGVRYSRRSNDTNARFRVTFLFDGRTLETLTQPHKKLIFLPSFYLTAANSSTEVVLGESYLRGRLGRQISCKAESYWDGYEPGNEPTSSTMLSRAKYYAALESTSYVVSPTQGSNFEIVFLSTLPLTCGHCKSANCSCNYIFRMKSNEASGLNCAVKWATGYTATAQIYIFPGLSQSSISYGMTFEPYNDDFEAISLWHAYIIPPVMVTTVPSEVSYMYCHSVTDPNIYTFDNEHFSNFQVGDFYLVRTNLSMEIQVRQEVCSLGSCNCGVIVREGNSAFKISICEKGPWNATVQRSPSVIRLLSQKPVDNSVVYRDGTGTGFSIRMPSGLRVEIDSPNPWFNIYVYLPPLYHGNTSSDSMCGSSDGNSRDSNSYTHHGDYKYYRIPDEKNYFKRQPECSTVFNAPVAKCDCSNTTTFKCSNSDKLLEIVSKSKDPLPDRWSTGIVCHSDAAKTGKRSRRSNRGTRETVDFTISNSDFILDQEAVYPPYSYDPNFGMNVSFTWPTPKGKTEMAVTQYCENMVNSSVVYRDCNASADTAEIIRTCKTDIQVIDEWLPGGAYTSIFEENCVNQLAANINSSDSSNSSDSYNGTDPYNNITFATLISIYERTCPNRCNGQGTCIEAACVCNQGYIGTDCGIQESQPPVLTSIIRNGVCDVRRRPCDVIAIFGSGIISTAELKCRFQDQSTGRYAETNGTFITIGEYSCPVPSTTTHRRRRATTAQTKAISKKDVSLTMNEVVYSNSIPFVLFDSSCMQCSSSKTCSQRNDACVINGQCYVNGSTNTNNRCLRCLPKISLNSWTDITVVQEWKPCTRQCDYGARSKDTLCGGTSESTEVELCKVTDCPENKDEENEGVGFTFSDEDLEKILTEPEKFLNLIAEALNSYCSSNVIRCCQSVGVSATSVSSVSYTSPNLTTYASGYPVLNTSDRHMVKIIVKIDKNGLMADCADTEPLSSNIVYAEPRLLYKVVFDAKTDIEMELGITIKSIWSQKPVTPEYITAESQTQEPVASEHIVSKHVTTETQTQKPVTSESIIPKRVSTETQSQKPVTSEPIVPKHVSTEAQTHEPITSEPIIPGHVTTEPRSHKPVTFARVTPEASTLELFTTKSVNLKPITRKPITPEPVTPESITLECVAKKVVFSHPFTPAATISEPFTLKPLSQEHVIPGRATPMSLAPESVTTKSFSTDHVRSEFTPNTSTAPPTCSLLFPMLGAYLLFLAF